MNDTNTGQGLSLDPNEYRYTESTVLFVDDIMAELATDIPGARPRDKERDSYGDYGY